MFILLLFFIDLLSFHQAIFQREIGDKSKIKKLILQKKILDTQCSLCIDKSKTETELSCTLSHHYGCDCKDKLVCLRHEIEDICPICKKPKDFLKSAYNVDLSRILIESIKSGNFPLTKGLLEEGANPNYRINNLQSTWPIMHAAQRGPEFIDILLEHDAITNVKVSTRTVFSTNFNFEGGDEVFVYRPTKIPVCLFDYLFLNTSRDVIKDITIILKNKIFLDLRGFCIEAINDYIDYFKDNELLHDFGEMINQEKILLPKESYKHYLKIKFNS